MAQQPRIDRQRGALRDWRGMYGVSCFPDSLGLSSQDVFVIGLQLAGNSLSGSMPNASLWQQLPNLSEVDLSSNEITGSMHGVLGIGMSLSKLDLSYNPLTGLLPTSEWLQVPYLTKLTTANTENTGSLPVELSLYMLSQLSSLTLSSNRLNGSLPPEYALLSSLSGFLVDSNDLSGTLPPEWGRMFRLSVFACNDNPRLGGAIPDEWASLNLFIFALSRCSFTGTIPLWFQNLYIVGVRRTRKHSTISQIIHLQSNCPSPTAPPSPRSFRMPLRADSPFAPFCPVCLSGQLYLDGNHRRPRLPGAV